MDALKSHHFATSRQECTHDLPASSSAGDVDVQSLQHDMQQQFSIAGGSRVKILGVKHLWDGPGLELSGLDEVYVQPPSTNNPSLDAYYKHSTCGQVLLLQYTVSKRHATHAAPVVNFLKRLSPEDQRQAKMVFVIPGDNPQHFQAFQCHRWLGTTGKVRIAACRVALHLPVCVLAAAVVNMRWDIVTGPCVLSKG